ncbi:mesenchyme-specific cell surface glycoprotein-like [Littorina saxatilis]|uniref:Choice-of-anchor I domain-containing protein n=1 Tax=Littorina saxatilis TaxID=31220 RepID=A0AAN9C1T6_9CAEN
MRAWYNVCVLLVAGLSECRLVLDTGAYLKLPDGANKYTWNAGTATKASYDPVENLLYVIGHTADVVHVVNMTDPGNPVRLFTKRFSPLNQGLPNDVQVCRSKVPGGGGQLAVSFESAGLNQKGHVHFYALMESNNFQNYLTDALDVVTTESYDPRSVGWTENCTGLVVASEGLPHELNKAFEDPPADIEVLLPNFGTTVDRREIPISESKAAAAKVRQVFEKCTSGTGANQTSTLKQALEPTAVHVDTNDVAYILFQDNNAIASLNLTNPFAELEFFSLGTKDWSRFEFDGAYEDSGINLQSRQIVSFYQPRDMVSFEVDGKVWLATADTGSPRRVSLTSCRFDDSVAASSWRKAFSDGMTSDEVTKLKGEMAAGSQIGRIPVSLLKQDTDGWDPVYQGYDFVATFGGRGFSILDPVGMKRVYDSGDDFERYFTTPQATDEQKAMFNSYVSKVTEPQTAQFDRRSAYLGPQPSAIAAGAFNSSTQMLVIANGVTGGLYTYTVTSGPTVTFESYIRRGNAGLTWDAAFKQDSDAVGEPSITDLLYIEDQGQKTVVAVSQSAGALSFYSVRER